VRNCPKHERAQKDSGEIWPALILRPSLAPARYGAMSLEWIAAGVLICLFGMIALMPSFDGKWE
jgi:hypothetical protein